MKKKLEVNKQVGSKKKLVVKTSECKKKAGTKKRWMWKKKSWK